MPKLAGPNSQVGASRQIGIHGGAGLILDSPIPTQGRLNGRAIQRNLTLMTRLPGPLALTRTHGSGWY
jgi:hypothetical protein